MRILFVCHAHPELQAGGTELFSHGLFHELRARGHEGVFLAGTAAHQRPPAPGTALQAVGPHASDQLLWTAGFDTFFLSQTDLHGTVPELLRLVRELDPDIVHFHHFLTVGLEVFGLVRRAAPRAAIVLTLHDFYALCAHDGQMATPEGTLCRAASPDACRRCLPDRTATDFRVRSLHVANAFSVVDAFVAPSALMRDRFVEAGFPAGRIHLIRNGLPPIVPAPSRPGRDVRHDRFAFFGHLNFFKGAHVALRASAILSRQGVAHSLMLHGSSAHQSDAATKRIREEAAAAPDARLCGGYRREDMGRLIAAADWVVVPSIWWENAPLVIQEAFAHQRPVICSDVGGMAEMVTDGRNGIHAAVGNPSSFADAMRAGAEEGWRWSMLRSGMVPQRTMAQAADEHLGLYGRLRAEREMAA